jgi:hypothetical protein
MDKESEVMTQIGRILCALCGGLIGYSITYAWCRFWDFIGRKRVEIPDIKYDVADNPILSLKNRLGQAYVASHDQSVKKLLHRLLEYVEVIEEWHKSKINLAENKCNTYRTRAARAEVELATERSKNEELTKQLKDAELKNEQLRQMLKLNISKPLFTPQDWQNTYGKEPIPVGYFGTAMTATEATELAEHLQRIASQPIVMDSETLNEPTIKNEEFIKQLRDWWGLEASKAVELPNTVKKKWPDDWVDAIEAARDPDKWPEYMAKVEGIPKDFNKYKVTLYDNKENETIETELYGANIYDALKSIDNERYSALGYRCI